MSAVLPVAAIKTGTVIDHIDPGQALRIVSLLQLLQTKQRVTIGLYLPSKSMLNKDLIKIEHKFLTPAECSQVMVFAPRATINIIADFAVVDKISEPMPSSIAGVFHCPNHACISTTEALISKFKVELRVKQGVQQVSLTCVYCERSYVRDALKIEI